jgi:predicted component of type VI protein secretion system
MRHKIEIGELIIAALFFALLMFMLLGCKTGEKAVRKYKASSEFPGDCADKFPVKIDTTFIEGKATYDTIWSYDTNTITDTVINQQETTIYKDRIKTVTVTVKKVDTIQVIKENTARVEEQTRKADEYAALSNENGKNAVMWKERARKRLLWLLIAIGAVGAYIFLKIKKLLPW